MQVVDEVLGFAHHLRGGDALLARRAFGPEAPARTSGQRGRVNPAISLITADTSRGAASSSSAAAPNGAGEGLSLMVLLTNAYRLPDFPRKDSTYFIHINTK